MEGWIKLHWKSKDSAVFQDAIPWAVWTRILLSASRIRKVLRNGVVLERGDALVSSKQLADWAGVSTRTMQRLLRTFEAEGMIRVVQVSRNGTHLSVCNWSTYQNTDDRSDAKVTENGNATATQWQRNGTQTENPKIPKNPNPLGEFPEGWGEVGKRLRDRGVHLAVSAIRDAMANGVTPAEVEAIIDHYDDRPGAWESGGLFLRVTSAVPGQPVGRGWPEERAGYQLADRMQERDRRYQREQQRREHEQAERETRRRHEAELEARHGAAVDAMDRTEAERILRNRLGTDAAAPFIHNWKRGEPAGGMARWTLIEELEGCRA